MIKPIETVYKGYKFRSRLEARWAVFFDALGIVWEYEKEGYYLGDGECYLPDFWLPQLDMFVEVKGKRPTENERKKAYYLSKLSKKQVAIIGTIPDPYDYKNDDLYFGLIFLSYDDIDLEERRSYFEDEETFQRILEEEIEWEEEGFYPYDEFYFFSKCKTCKKFGFHFEGRTRQCMCGEGHNKGEYNNDDECLEYAYMKARQARFEHDERYSSFGRNLMRW